VKPSFIEQEVVKAQGNPRRITDIKRFHLNIWVDNVVTTGLDMEKWDACRVTPVTLEALAGRKVWGGLDLSATTDLTALALVAPRPDGGVDVWWRFWLPVPNEKALRERVKRDRVAYDKWIAAGLIRATEGDVVDYDVIRAEITGKGERAEDALLPDWIPIAKRVDLQELAIDRWNATQVTTQLTADEVTVVPFGQGFASMSAPSKELERQVNAGSFNHGGNPVARWMAGCVAFAEDEAGNMKPVKPPRRRTSKRIDGIVAAIMALGRAAVEGGPEKPATAASVFGGFA
jgi:phage terminase large subunit-like protein